VGKASEKLQLGKLSIQFRELLEYQVEQRTQDVRLLSDDLLRSKEKIQSLKRQLLASNKIKSEFLDMINHELRTPLTPILGFAELIAQTSEEKGNMEEYRYSKIISSAGSKLLNIIDTMLELVDADNGNLELNIVEVSMLDIVGRVIDALSSSAESSSINLTTSIIKNPIPMVQGDSTRLIQAIYNIVNNSIRHCPPGTNVIVAVRGLGKELTISVSDDGGGMNEVELKAARQSFGQVDGGHTRTVGGIGLGLTLANILIELHGGRMTISSQKGLGTKVEMIIPRTGVYDRCFPSQLKRKMT
jgi:signal transduction histidine kinase